MKTLADLVAYIEGRFPSVEGLPTNHCQTGDHYAIVGAPEENQRPPAIPGTIDDGARRASALDEETAVNLARMAFDRYAEGRSGMLYWRTPPRLEWDRQDRRVSEARRCRVYLRLVISGKTGACKAAPVRRKRAA